MRPRAHDGDPAALARAAGRRRIGLPGAAARAQDQDAAARQMRRAFRGLRPAAHQEARRPRRQSARPSTRQAVDAPPRRARGHVASVWAARAVGLARSSSRARPHALSLFAAPPARYAAMVQWRGAAAGRQQVELMRALRRGARSAALTDARHMQRRVARRMGRRWRKRTRAAALPARWRSARVLRAGERGRKDARRAAAARGARVHRWSRRRSSCDAQRAQGRFMAKVAAMALRRRERAPRSGCRPRGAASAGSSARSTRRRC